MREISWGEAEKLIGARVDRRKKYATTDDGQATGFFDHGEYVLFQLIKWTDSCSGCTETIDGYNVNNYPIDKKHGCMIGGGCEECGYTGKRLNEMWIPCDLIKNAIQF